MLKMSQTTDYTHYEDVEDIEYKKRRVPKIKIKITGSFEEQLQRATKKEVKYQRALKKKINDTYLRNKLKERDAVREELHATDYSLEDINKNYINIVVFHTDKKIFNTIT